MNDDEGTCTAACKRAVCGDGLVNVHEYQEECDDGNTVNDDQCSNGCARFCCSPILATYGTNWVSFAGGGWHSPPGSHPQYVSPSIAVARDGRGLLVYKISEDRVQAVLFKDGVWHGAVPPEEILSLAEPAASVHDGGFHVVYEGVDDMNAYYAGFDGELWEPLAEPLPVDSLGLGTVVTLAGDAAYVYHDAAQDGALMMTMRAPTWQPPELISPETQNTRPAAVALTAGPELMVVDGNRSFTRTLGMWSPPTTVTDAEIEPGSVSLAALPDGGAAVVWTNGSHDVLVAFHDMNADQWSPPEVVVNAEFPAKIAAGLGPATLELVTASKNTFRHARRIDDVWEIHTENSNGGNGPGLVSLGSASP